MLLSAPHFASAAVLFHDNFDGYTDSPANHGWTIPSAATIENGDSPDGGRVLKFDIQNGGTAQYWTNFDPNPNGTFSDGYISFWAKETNHADGTPGGVKWLKLFSADYGGTTATYANVTFGQDYGLGRFYQVSSGEGFPVVNDTQAAYNFNGYVAAGTWYPNTIYQAGYTSGYATHQIYTAKVTHTSAADNEPGVGANWRQYWDLVGTVTSYSAPFYSGDGWHFYEYRVKHNTDNNFDGEFAMWLDGQQKISVTGMRNRNNVNAMDWNSASLVNHVENPPLSPYQIYFDDIKTSDTYIPYASTVSDTIAPAAPSGLTVQ